MRYLVGTGVTLFWVIAAIGAFFITIDLAHAVTPETNAVPAVFLVIGVFVFLWYGIYAVGMAARNTIDMFTNPEYDA